MGAMQQLNCIDKLLYPGVGPRNYSGHASSATIPFLCHPFGAVSHLPWHQIPLPKQQRKLTCIYTHLYIPIHLYIDTYLYQYLYQ
jgi:hypothetical protein